MLKTLIKLVTNFRGTDDDYYYLVFDEENGEIFIEHTWDYFFRSANKNGTRYITLRELKETEPEIYEMAAQMIKTKIFSNQ